MNSRLRRADNAKFLEHFRYIIVASQLLDEYIDQGTINLAGAGPGGLDGTGEDLHPHAPSVSVSLYGASMTAFIAFLLVYVIHWSRSSQSGYVSITRLLLAVVALIAAAIWGYAYVRRQWLRFIRTNAVNAASHLTTHWQTLELSAGSALSFIQEVELVSKGYRLSTPLPPASRIEDANPANRRCARHRKILYRAYASLIPACVEACVTLQQFISEDDLEKYFEIYDISASDAREASTGLIEDDPESLKSLRVLSYRAGILRRTTLCSLMALEADGGHPDVHRWRVATEVMENLAVVTSAAVDSIRQILTEAETFSQVPATPASKAGTTGHASRDKLRGQVRKISALSSGIKGLQAKMQILREEANRAIEGSVDDLTDLGPNLLAQYEALGADLRDLLQAWEAGQAALQSNLTRQERRFSRASLSSGGMRSPVSSLGGLTAVDEDGGPSGAGSISDALRRLSGHPGAHDPTLSPLSSIGPFSAKHHPNNAASSASGRTTPTTTGSPSEGEPDSSQNPNPNPTVFEGLSLPRQRQRSLSALSRADRLARMQEDRDRQAAARARRDANTGMLRELESVIKLRAAPPPATAAGTTPPGSGTPGGLTPSNAGTRTRSAQHSPSQSLTGGLTAALLVAGLTAEKEKERERERERERARANKRVSTGGVMGLMAAV